MNRLWSLVAKVAGGFLLFAGGITSLGLLAGILVGHATGGLLTLLVILLVMFGFAPALLGFWMVQLGFKAQNQALRDTFFQVLRSHQGRFSLLDYATATRLEPAVARRHLDQWARELAATYDVTDNGEIYYIFAEPTLPPERPATLLMDRIVQRLERML